MRSADGRGVPEHHRLGDVVVDDAVPPAEDAEGEGVARGRSTSRGRPCGSRGGRRRGWSATSSSCRARPSTQGRSARKTPASTLHAPARAPTTACWTCYHVGPRRARAALRAPRRLARGSSRACGPPGREPAEHHAVAPRRAERDVESVTVLCRSSKPRQAVTRCRGCCSTGRALDAARERERACPDETTKGESSSGACGGGRLERARGGGLGGGVLRVAGAAQSSARERLRRRRPHNTPRYARRRRPSTTNSPRSTARPLARAPRPRRARETSPPRPRATPPPRRAERLCVPAPPPPAPAAASRGRALRRRRSSMKAQRPA